jgi:integrase
MRQDRRAGGRTILPISSRRGGWSLSGTSVVRRGSRFAVACYAGIDPETKKQRYKWFSGFSTKREADQFARQLAHHPLFGAGAGPNASAHLRTQDYLRGWTKERATKGLIRPKTRELEEMLINRHIVPRLGHVALSRLGAPAIDGLYVTLLQRNVSRSTVKRIAQLLHTALAHAVKTGRILKNPCAGTTPPAADDYEPTLPSIPQLHAYLEDARATATPAEYAVYVTAVGTGARLGELLGLSEEAFEGRAIHIERTLRRAGREPAYGKPKTKRGHRVVLLPGEAIDAIRAALLWKHERRLKVGPKRPGHREYRDSGLLFVGPYGRPLNASNLRNRDHFDRLTRLELPRFRLHDLRHLQGTYLNARRVDARHIADRLGHSRASFTADRYIHADPQGQELAAAIANELLMKTVVSTGDAKTR